MAWVIGVVRGLGGNKSQADTYGSIITGPSFRPSPIFYPNFILLLLCVTFSKNKKLLADDSLMKVNLAGSANYCLSQSLYLLILIRYYKTHKTASINFIDCLESHMHKCD